MLGDYIVSAEFDTTVASDITTLKITSSVTDAYWVSGLNNLIFYTSSMEFGNYRANPTGIIEFAFNVKQIGEFRIELGSPGENLINPVIISFPFGFWFNTTTTTTNLESTSNQQFNSAIPNIISEFSLYLIYFEIIGLVMAFRKFKL